MNNNNIIKNQVLSSESSLSFSLLTFFVVPSVLTSGLFSSIVYADRVNDTIDAGSEPIGIAYFPAGGNMYVINSGDDTVSFIEEGLSTNEDPTIGDTIRGILQNPLDIGNSIESANQIKEILTDNNPSNDGTVCVLLAKLDNDKTQVLRDLINC